MSTLSGSCNIMCDNSVYIMTKVTDRITLIGIYHCRPLAAHINLELSDKIKMLLFLMETLSHHTHNTTCKIVHMKWSEFSKVWMPLSCDT